MSDSDIVNQTELRVVGMSRSGNHVIINWIGNQSPGRYCFFNCAEPKTNPFKTARTIDGVRRAVASYDDFNLKAEAAGDFSRKDLLIYSYEDCFLSTVCHRDFERRHDEYIGRSKRRIDLLILRDPFNLFASRMQSQFGGVTPLTAIRIWRQHARQFLGERNYVTQEFLPVSFNRWASDAEYRRQLADRIGLEFSDEGFDTVPSTGGGSSFDRRRYQGRTQQMDLFGRWRHFQHDEDYCELFDEELLRLSDEIFGGFDDSEEFVEFHSRLEEKAAARVR